MDAGCWPWLLWLIHDSQRLLHAKCIVAMLLGTPWRAAGVKMKLKLEVVSCANTSWCTKCIQMSQIDSESHHIFSFYVRRLESSQSIFNPANSMVHSHALLSVIATFRPWKYGLIHALDVQVLNTTCHEIWTHIDLESRYKLVSYIICHKCKCIL